MARLLILLSALFLVTKVQASTQFWDHATNAGYQHGDGTWSLSISDTNWTGQGGLAPQITWTNGNDAAFSSVLAGSSRITVDSAVTVSVLAVYGSMYTITVTNGGRMFVTNSAGMSLSSCSTNLIRVIGGAGTTSIWDNGLTDLSIGGIASNSFIIDGAGVEGSAVVTNVGDLFVGRLSDDGSTMIVTNKGVLNVKGLLKVGAGSSSQTDASLVIARGGIVRTTNTTSVGFKTSNGNNSWRNSLIVRDAGSLLDGGGARLIITDISGGGSLLTHWRNQMILDGGTITNVSFGAGFDIGSGGYYRQNEEGTYILVTNGGRMFCVAASTIFHRTGGGTPGFTSINSTDIVTGVTTLWDNGGQGLSYAYSGREDWPSASNSITLDDGALMTNVGFLSFASYGSLNNTFVITNGARLYSTNGLISSGGGTISSNNRFVVTGNRLGKNSLWNLGGGALQVGGTSITNTIPTNRCNLLIIDGGGTIENVSSIRCTSNGNAVLLYGGILSAANMSISNGLFTIGDGVQPALLKLAAGTNLFPNGLLVQSNGTFRGGGTFLCGAPGLIVTNNGTIEPGAGPTDATVIGRLTITGSCSLAARSISRFEIMDASKPGTGWDIMIVSNGLLSLGGIIKPVLADVFRPYFTNTFIIISNTSPGNIVNRFDTGGGDRVNVFNNNMLRTLGTFRVGYSNQYVVLDGFRPYSGGMTTIVR